MPSSVVTHYKCALGLLGVVAIGSCFSAPTSISPTDSAILALQSYKPNYTFASASHSPNHQCTIDANETCPLVAMNGSTTMVYPGGETRCIFSHSSKYAFQVFPGSTENVVIYFQGGGTCWDHTSTTLHLCVTDAQGDGDVGIFDRTNPLNPYADYTILNVLYCSGDAHSGNVTREYSDINGVPVQQSGYHNTRAALDWLKSNLGPAPISNLVLGGCSAGSIGLQAWAGTIFNEFQAANRAFIADSFAGLFPPSSQGPTIKGYGICELDIMPDELKPACREETITLQDWVFSTIGSFPEIPFSFIQAKEDIVQRAFYAAIAATFGEKSSWMLSGDAFYRKVNDIWGRYAAHKNFMSYTIEGGQHCYSPLPYFYTASTEGKDGGRSQEQQKLAGWVERLPIRVGGNISTECHGVVQAAANATGVDYCDARLAARVFEPSGPVTLSRRRVAY